MFVVGWKHKNPALFNRIDGNLYSRTESIYPEETCKRVRYDEYRSKILEDGKDEVETRAEAEEKPVKKLIPLASSKSAFCSFHSKGGIVTHPSACIRCITSDLKT